MTLLSQQLLCPVTDSSFLCRFSLRYAFLFGTCLHMKLMLRPEWRLWPISTFLHLLDLKTGVTIALLFAVSWPPTPSPPKKRAGIDNRSYAQRRR